MTTHLTYLKVAPPRGPSHTDFEAQQRGKRAARLALACAYVINHLDESGLNAEKVGKHLAISGRAVQLLFESQGTTFSAYVREQRLLKAFRHLRDPSLDTTAISEIAYSSGFVDLSHFNRCFRRRFGETPSGVRSQAA